MGNWGYLKALNWEDGNNCQLDWHSALINLKYFVLTFAETSSNVLLHHLLYNFLQGQCSSFLMFSLQIRKPHVPGLNNLKICWSNYHFIPGLKTHSAVPNSELSQSPINYARLSFSESNRFWLSRKYLDGFPTRLGEFPERRGGNCAFVSN